MKAAMKDGPVRFTYEKLRIDYILRNSGSEDYPNYHLRIEGQGRMISDASYGSGSLEEILKDHPLDRFTSERTLV